MKNKILAIITVFLLVFTLSPIYENVSAATDTELFVGDTNNDAEINLLDVVQLAQYVAEWDVSLTATDDNPYKLGNTNGDAEINLLDVVQLAQYVAEWDIELVGRTAGGYMTSGDNFVAEVIKYQAETFDGDNTNDLSQPYNNYLPEGTLDYASEKDIYDSSSGNTYKLLNYGKRVYTKSGGVDNIRTMRGSLPETNKISVKSFTTDGSHTTLTLKTEWRAPFKFELAPQRYQSTTGSARGTITAATFNYVDITFCYSSAFDCNIDEFAKSPIFSKAEIIKNTDDYTLRLYLEKTGAFYGWTANYNSDGDLVFDFLNPAKATVAENEYGGRLDGITIVVDAGHGGTDCGAVGSILGSNKEYTEAARNLYLAKMVEERLISIGANVVMTRTDDSALSSDNRILAVKNAKPNMAISIHRNGSTYSSARGFIAHYFNAYTKFLADKITNQTSQSNTYTKYETKWHVFFLSRISDCPVTLLENGFMTNSDDFINIISEEWNERCADAIVQGIVNYFLSIG